MTERDDRLLYVGERGLTRTDAELIFNTDAVPMILAERREVGVTEVCSYFGQSVARAVRNRINVADHDDPGATY